MTAAAPYPHQETPTAARSICLVSHSALNLLRFRAVLMEELVATGWRVTCVAPPGPHMPTLTALAEDLGAAVRPWPLARGSLSVNAFRQGARSLALLLREVAPSVTHTFTHQPNLVARFALPRRRRPVVVNSVTGLGSIFLAKGVKSAALRVAMRQLYKRTASRTDAVIFQNREDQANFEWGGLTGAAVSMLIRGSGVDLTRFRPDLLTADQRAELLAELGLKRDHVVCVMAARLVHDKGIRELLLAARALTVGAPRLRLVIVGAPDEGNPRSLSRDDMVTFSALGNVVFTGWREDMPALWAAADLAVLPSYREGLPVSLQEAMASGLPVVTTDAPGCRELAMTPDGEPDHTAAVLTPRGQWPPLAEALARLAASTELRRAMGEAARAKAEREFDARTQAQRHLAVYESLLARSR